MSAISFTEASERVKSGLDIVDVIQRHVILKKSGRNYTGKCPFHNDKSPSMNVSREKGIFKCFSCGVGGDALTFLMRIENKTFGEIIRELAQEQGIEILYEGRGDSEFAATQAATQKDARQKILELNTAANQWFQTQLQTPDADFARHYFEKRYPDEATRQTILTQFQLGYAPNAWEALTPYLKEKFEFVQANPDLLLNAGLSNNRDYGQGHYDRFRNRFIIPIHDDKGNVVAFGGRSFSDEDKPKYLNSPETAIYKKSQVLYGFFQAKESIRQSKAAVVMEGYFDVISAHLGGITEAVGSCGTAMTESHLKLLTRFGAETVYLAFDSDEAGIKAALSAITLIEPYVIHHAYLDLKVLIVPDGKDPDDFVRQHGGNAFRDLMRTARPYLTFKCDMALRDLSFQTAEGRIQGASRLTPILANIVSRTVQLEYFQKYAEKMHLTAKDLELEVRRYEQSRNPTPRPVWGDFQKSSGKKAISKSGSTSLKRNPPLITDNFTMLRASLTSHRQEAAEKSLLKLMFYNLDSFSAMMHVLDQPTQLRFSDPLHQEILMGIWALAENGSLNQTDLLADGPSGTLIEKMNHLYFDQPDVLHRLVELIMNAESFGDSIGLGELKGAIFREKVIAFAEQQISQLAVCRTQEHLKTIKTSASQNPGDEIELTYEFTERWGDLRQTTQMSPPEEASTFG